MSIKVAGPPGPTIFKPLTDYKLHHPRFLFLDESIKEYDMDRSKKHKDGFHRMLALHQELYQQEKK